MSAHPKKEKEESKGCATAIFLALGGLSLLLIIWRGLQSIADWFMELPAPLSITLGVLSTYSIYRIGQALELWE